LTVRLACSLMRKDWNLIAREGTAFMYGLLPVLAVLAYFKLTLAPANSWISADSYFTSHSIQHFRDPGTLARKLTDVSRYQLIARTMASEIIQLGGRRMGITPLLGLYLISAKVNRKSVESVQTGIALLPLMLFGYFLVYLATPLNLAFHLRTSLLRLLLQLWPSAVFILFMITSSAEPRNGDSTGAI